ncbi:MAG TPA: SseB family protein, partial [Micromonosporaceae bacterium]
MTEWEPATEAEAAMRDALRMSDQELYFRILSRSELLLPVSADALAGRTAMGWGTWNSGGRTHVLSFTSSEAMQVCLAENAGSARKIAFHELANTWPNHEWWLAVNPGLPIEGYLPPWFVGQIARGDVRVPGRSSRRDGAGARRTPPSPPPPSMPPPMPPPTAHTGPLEPDDVLEADVLEAEDTQVVSSPTEETRPSYTAQSGRRTGPTRGGGRDPVRRLRRYEASIIDATVIDAEIISSTVLGASAMEAMVVDATVINATGTGGMNDADVIDATVIDVDERTQVVNRSARPGTTAPDGTGARSGPTPPMAAAATGARRRAAAAKGSAAAGISAGPSFTPANEVETNLLAAASSAKTDNFLSTLLLAKVLIPIPTGESPTVRPDDPAFPWRREVVDGQAYLVVFTSPERMTEFMGDGVVAVTAKFVQLIRVWPDVNWAFAVNPGTPVGATLPGAQIKALAVWAADVGLTADDPTVDIEEPAPPPPPPSTSTIIMQKPIAPSQVDYYLERGYDRASGFVHRATEVAHLHTPEQIYSTLGLSYTGSPFQRDATDVYVLRWAAHRGDLYRIPYGGQHEAAMRAMQGWMIERAPFRGNGFAPAERGEVIAEFKVDSIRLPHGAQMWRLTSTGDRMLVAILDADEGAWRAAIDAGVSAEWDPTVP